MSQKERSSLPPQVPEALIQAVLVGRDHTAPQVLGTAGVRASTLASGWSQLPNAASSSLL